MNKEFIKKLEEFDPTACRILYDEYKVLLFGICSRYASNPMEAEDMLQVGFMGVYNAIPSFKNKGSFDGFVKKVFLNHVLQFVRKNYKALYQTDAFEPSKHEESFDAAIISNLQYEQLMKYIQDLPKGYRVIFNLFAIDGYKHLEISELLNISASTSRSQYTRAKQLLQKKILESEKINIHE